LKFSVTPIHQSHSFILQNRTHTENRILRTVSSVPHLTKKRKGDIPLRNLLPEVSDAWGLAWGRSSGVESLTHCILGLYVK
jgi:hypothetical protein